MTEKKLRQSVIRDRIVFVTLLVLAVFAGGTGLACAHEGHHSDDAPQSEVQSKSPSVVFQNQASESVDASSSTGSLSTFDAQGELPESCICCGSSHEAAVTAAAPTFSAQKKQATGAAVFGGAPPAIVQSRTLIAVREHGPPVAAVKIHLLINIFLI